MCHLVFSVGMIQPPANNRVEVNTSRYCCLCVIVCGLQLIRRHSCTLFIIILESKCFSGAELMIGCYCHNYTGNYVNNGGYCWYLSCLFCSVHSCGLKKLRLVNGFNHDLTAHVFVFLMGGGLGFTLRAEV